MLKRFTFLLLLLCLMVVVPTIVYASTDVVISGVSVEATLNEDRTINVVETYTAYIYNEVDSITMTLPLKQTVMRQTASGEEELVYAVEYSDISLYDRHVTTSVDGDTLVITTQGASFEPGAVQIPLVYTFNSGVDNTIGADEIVFLPIRGGRETSMGSFSLTFNFPSEVSAENILLSSSVGATAVDFSLTGTTLTGYNLESIPPEHDVLLQATMQDGYFLGGLSTDDTQQEFTFDNLIYVIVITVLTLITFFNIIFRLPKKIKPCEATHPPEDFSPAELYHLLRSQPSRRSVLSSLIALAIKGYVAISFGDTGLVVTKKLNPDENLPLLQQEIMMISFASCEQFLLDKRRLAEMTAEFSEIARRSIGRSIELESNLVYGMSISMTLLLGLAAGGLTGLYYGIDLGLTRMLLMSISVGLPFVIGGLFLRSGLTAMRRKRPAPLLFVGISVILFSLCWGVMTVINSSDPLVGGIFLAIITLLLIVTAALNRKSSYACEIISQTESLNRLITTIQPEKLSSLLSNEEDYFLTLLPHAVCFSNESQLVQRYEESGIPISSSANLPPIKELCDLLPG